MYDLKWLTKQNPKFTTLRPHQEKAVAEILDAYDRTNIVVVEAPTGSGKTVLAEVVRHELSARGLFLCTTIQLQEQFIGDFGYSRVLKGRRNYTPELIDSRFNPLRLSCDDCNGTPPSKNDCTLCNERRSCPYEVEKAAAYRSDVAVLNTSYFLHEANGVDKGISRSRAFVVVDEADQLERQLLGYVEFRISDQSMADFSMVPVQKGAHKKTIVSWLEELRGRLGFWMETHDCPYGTEDTKGIRKYKRNEKLLDAVDMVLGYDLDERWVRDNNAGPMVLKPVHVKDMCQEYLWRHSRQVYSSDGKVKFEDCADAKWIEEDKFEVPGKWLLMSGTIIAPDMYMKALGKDVGEYEFVSVESTFPVENRPVYITNAADMTKKGGQEDGGWKQAVQALGHIAQRHPDERILVHSVSYQLAQFLSDGQGVYPKGTSERILTYVSAQDRTATLRLYEERPDAILVAASMDRGVDLRDDLCRVIVVAKLPYPYLGDPQVNARKNSREEGLGQTWYELETGRTLVQMTGRGVRSETDHCVTYILDQSFSMLVKRKWVVPEWWRQGVDRTFNANRWRRECGL